MIYILTALVALAGSCVQSSSGFGYAIICMAIWPMFMPFYTASILEAIAAFFMVIYIAVKLWKFIDWKLLLPPVVMATVTSFLGVNTLMALDEAVLSKIMGTVLLVLAVYFIFFSSKVHLKAGLFSGLAAGAVSVFLIHVFQGHVSGAMLPLVGAALAGTAVGTAVGMFLFRRLTMTGIKKVVYIFMMCAGSYLLLS